MSYPTWKLVDGPEGRLAPKPVWPRERDEDGLPVDDDLNSQEDKE